MDGAAEDYGNEDIAIGGMLGTGPSEQEMVYMTERFNEEQALFNDGQGGPTSPLDWFCNVSHL